MHIIHYLSHYKKDNLLFDYYEDTKQGVIKYVLKVDGKTIYKDNRSLSDKEIKQKVQSYVLHSSKYNEPKNESSSSSVLPMTL